MDVSVLIISYNTRDLTAACLRSVFAETRDLSFEVIVLDNASSDGSAELVAAEFPQVRLLRPGRNLGFAAGNNAAARHAAGDYLLLLNPDTVVLDNAIGTAAAFARAHPEAGVVGGRTFKADGSLDYRSCHGRPTPWSSLCMGIGLSSLFQRSRLFNPESLGRWRRDTVRRVDAVSGCFFLVERCLWQQLGGFDESFFMYWEDTDLCLRAGAAGRACLICPDAKLIHHGAQSDRVRSEKIIRLFRAKAQLVRKHWSPATRGLGVWSLNCYALSRLTALGLLRRLWPRRPALGESYAVWQEVWSRRGEFAAPTPAGSQPGAAPRPMAPSP
jgi:GT2 family glycosyltransferase